MSEMDMDILFGDDDGVATEIDPPYPGRHRQKSRTGNLLPDRTVPASTLALDHSTSNPLVNKLRTTRDTATTCPGLWKELAEHCPDHVAIIDEHMCDDDVRYTFQQMEEEVRRSAAVFQNLGVSKGDNVAVLGENSARWLVADHGIQLAGGASAVRGADAPADELRYIYEHSDSAGVAVMQGPRLFQRLRKDAKKKGGTESGLGLSNESHGPVRTVVLLHREKKTDEQIQEMAEEAGVTVHVLADLLAKTEPMSPFEAGRDLGLDDIATIVYTSGTTGSPKGVMLSHGNLLHQIGHRLAPTQPYDESEPLPGDCTLALLPVWHITERTFELWIFARGCTVVYSSIRSFKNDLAKFQPQWMVLVPRVLEKVALGVQDKFANGSAAVKTLVKLFTATGTLAADHTKISKGLVVADVKPPAMKRLASKAIVAALSPINAVGNKLVWSKVKDGFGGRCRTIIAGGSALSGSLESFYELCGLTVCVGYGLTECSPLIAHRRSDANMITAGCVGKPTIDTELRVVDPERNPNESERPSLPDGEVGVVVGRGPQVMRGYYKNPEATGKAIDRYGWFDTGDLGRVNPATGDLILTGRCKDTIVLSNGENIEPAPIEDAILSESDAIEQICLTGQDGRSLVAIAVLNPAALVEGGYIDESKAKELQKADEKVNDPKLSADDVVEECRLLQKASEQLRKNDALKKALLGDMKTATKDFRAYERVSDVYVTLEPFAMSNGLLTQSYKVKRDVVVNRYGDEL
uniref:AMP-dependent synthetase/ligase domain-containing protein n=2 Tax=Odontella aurita TaxID=265563 RepID=A0A7S4JM27_9STRA|mmetsp:Transcript_49364/g.148650  ORF Transcript_49364/g.148650 Transcript_49364/m.148650 type:complete len:750 (+) Transcript_49364:81-2330(+)